MWQVYWHTTPINACEIIWACGLYVTFQEHVCCWYIFCNSMVNKCCGIDFDGCVQ